MHRQLSVYYADDIPIKFGFEVFDIPGSKNFHTAHHSIYPEDFPAAPEGQLCLVLQASPGISCANNGQQWSRSAVQIHPHTVWEDTKQDVKQACIFYYIT